MRMGPAGRTLSLSLILDAIKAPVRLRVDDIESPVSSVPSPCHHPPCDCLRNDNGGKVLGRPRFDGLIRLPAFLFGYMPAAVACLEPEQLELVT